MSGKFKGQFFIMGALILCTIFIVGMPSLLVFSSPYDEDLDVFSENLESEIPHAINLEIIDSGNPGSFGDFLSFLSGQAAGKNIKLEILWIATQPDESSPGDIDIYVGNWLGDQEQVSVDLDGNARNYNLDDKETGSDLLSGLGSSFPVEVSFQDKSYSGEFTRDKTNFYCFVKITRGDSVIVNEFVG